METSLEVSFTPADFEKRGVADGDRVLIHTGWDRYFKPFDPLYYDLGHPHFSAEGVEWILEHKLALVGMDVPSTDPYLIDHPKVFRDPENFPIILELMTNLDKVVGKEVYLMALPMHLAPLTGVYGLSFVFATMATGVRMPRATTIIKAWRAKRSSIPVFFIAAPRAGAEPLL